MPRLQKALLCLLLVAAQGLALGAAFGRASAQTAPKPAQAVDPAALERAKAELQAMSAFADKDPELANHFGLFKAKAVAPKNRGMLVAAANILVSVAGKRVTPDSLNELAIKEKLYSENAYGDAVALDSKGFCRLLSLGSGGRFAVSLEHRVEGRVPDEEVQEAEASSDLFVILAYLDHAPMIESRVAWSPEGRIVRVGVVNPFAAEGDVAYKTKSEYDPAAFDAWEFYRFRKSIR